MAGGGTGGHVMPLLAVAEELRRRGHEPFFVGTRNGFEARLVPARGFPIEYVEVSGFQGAGLASKFRLLTQLPKSVFQCLGLIKRQGFGACFSLGGYVAGPPVIASILRKLPLVVMEPNAMPGLVNRVFGKYAKKALLSFEAARAHFKAEAVEISGLPVREEFFRIEPKRRGPVFQVFVTGGSQGSQTINRAIRELWPLLAADPSLRIKILHQCGRREEESLREAFGESEFAGRFEYELTAFVDDMPTAFAEADLIVCRAGAGTISELMASGRASVLIPYPYATDDHQTRNAQAMLGAGAGLMLSDKDCNGEALFRLISNLAEDSAALARMGSCAKGLARPGAAARAADILEELASAKGLSHAAQ